MLNIQDLDFNQLQEIIENELRNANNNWKQGLLIGHTTQRYHIELAGEANMDILAISYFRGPQVDDETEDEYYAVQDNNRDDVHNFIAHYMALVTKDSEYKPYQYKPAEDHETWTTKDDDRITLDLADDSLVITRYLSGQY